MRRAWGLLLLCACATQPAKPAFSPEPPATPAPPPSKGWVERSNPDASAVQSTPPTEPVTEAPVQGTPDEGAIKGTLDKDHIRGVIRTKLGEVRRCYNTALSRDASLKGRIAVQFTISPDGKVREAVVAESDLADPMMQACLVSVAKEFVFRKPEGGGNVVVTYPFVFESTPPRTSDPAYESAAAVALGMLRPEVDACFRVAGGTRPEVAVEFTVDASGKASNVTVRGLAPDSATLDRCITEVFAKATMPKPDHPPVQVTAAP